MRPVKEERNTPVWQVMDEYRRQMTTVLTSYNKGLVPLGVVASISGRLNFQIWHSLVSESSARIRAFGREEISVQELREAVLQETPVIAEPTAVYTVTLLAIEHKAAAYLPSLMTQTATLDELNNEMDLQALRSVGTLVALPDGTVARTETSEQERAEIVSLIQRARAFVRDQTVLVAAMRALDLSAHGNSVIANPARDIS